MQMKEKCRCQCCELTEKELLSLLPHGCRRARQDAEKRYYPELYNTARALLPHNEAESTAKNILKNSLKNLHEYNHQNAFPIWLRRRLIDRITGNSAPAAGDGES